MVLGLELEWKVGDIRAGMLSKVKESLLADGAAMDSIDGGLTKREYLNYEIRSAIAEGDRVDLIAMGRSERPGCYCAVNHNLREVVDAISKNYRYVVIDNEAGMEHLSHRTTRGVQHLILVSDPTQRGIVAAERIASFRHELDIRIENTYLVLNRLHGDLPEPLQQRIGRMDIPLLGIILDDAELAAFEYNARPFLELPDHSPVYTAVADMLRTIGL